MTLTKTFKQIGESLHEFYDTMQKLEKISDYQEREGKKGTKLIMTINDIEKIAFPSDSEVTKWYDENIDKDCSASTAIAKYRLWLENR